MSRLFVAFHLTAILGQIPHRPACGVVLRVSRLSMSKCNLSDATTTSL